MPNISEKIIEKIKKEHIAPKPKWEFLLKDSIIWFFSVVLLIIGSLSFSVIIYLIWNNDWSIYEKINNSLLEFTILSLPYIWIVFLILFILAIHYNIRHTEKGYRYEAYKIVFGSVAISILFGGLLFNIGVGQAIDRVFNERVPFYEEFFDPHRDRWNNSEKGFLGGRVKEIINENEFKFIDLKDREWTVLCSSCPCLASGMGAKVIGESENGFIYAEIVVPAGPRGDRWLRNANMPRLPASSCSNNFNCLCNERK